MKEGYYWIQHVGVVQVAYYTNDTVDDLESGKTITGVWHLTRAMTFAITVKQRC